MLVAVQRWHQRRWPHSDECSVQWPLPALGPSGRKGTQLSTSRPHAHNQSNMTQYGVGIVPLSHVCNRFTLLSHSNGCLVTILALTVRE